MKVGAFFVNLLMTRFLRTILIAVFIGCSLCTNAQTDSANKIQHGISFGLNQIPLNYFEAFNGNNFNAVYFGWHAGYFLEREKLNYRGGLNFNFFRNGWGNSIHQDIGIEFGVEAPLLNPSRKWIINPGLLMNVAGLRTHYSDRTYFDLWLMAGPNLCFGRKIGERWSITSETSLGIGYVYYSNGDEMVWYPEYQLHWWKFVGIGARYYFN